MPAGFNRTAPKLAKKIDKGKESREAGESRRNEAPPIDLHPPENNVQERERMAPVGEPSEAARPDQNGDSPDCFRVGASGRRRERRGAP